MAFQPKIITALVLLVSWLIFASAGLFYFGNQHYGPFDPDKQWQNPLAAVFSIEALGIAATAGKQVVHVRLAQCACNNHVNAHISRLNNDSQLAATAQFTRQVSEITVAGLALPAAPAVLIFENGQMIYAGPYASGPLCSPSDSLIAPILRNEVQLAGVWLNGEAQACRCLTG
ncbi:DUF6436 domain-containing protein [Arsukibacterium sp.]|uniref:DUF6436 domain-containing protein n=1 Tax=Arsukibacterium sp. TaxID=1977258 RepID=UPI00299EA08B|nr:DUF6436 domain-containing protein [Arsukibacterium sp.]MDX1676761.1 DUF6436 domain-containing protein [Arsukibacterium sp.]